MNAGIYYALLKARREMTRGMLSAARSTLAEAVETSLKVEIERDVLNDEQADVLALSLQIDLAMVRTGAAQRAYNSLKTRDEMITAIRQKMIGTLAQEAGIPFRSRSLYYPRQAGRMFLAATGRLSEALAGVDEEALFMDGCSSEDRSERGSLWEGRISRRRIELSVRAASLHEVVRYAAAWIPEQRHDTKERRRARDENRLAPAAEDSSVIEKLRFVLVTY